MGTRIEQYPSGAIELLAICWRHNQEVTGHSWQRMNETMHRALMLAVQCGMRFAPDDLTQMMERFNAGYWCGNLEYFYRAAVFYRNPSAWQAFETYRGRKPFIWKPARVKSWADEKHGQDENPPRLVIGAEFLWKGERVTVTSFKDGDEPYLTACSYNQVGGYETCAECSRANNYPRDVLKSRYKITHVDLRQAKHDLQAAKDAAAVEAAAAKGRKAAA